MTFAYRLKLAVRSLRKSPGYVAAFVLTLGLGIGLNTAIFSVVNGVLLKPLPFDDAERIMYLQQPSVRAGVSNSRFSFHEVADVREGTTSFDEVVEFGDWTYNVVGRGDPHRAPGGLVTSNYFDVLGIRALHGRTLTADDDLQDSEPVMVLTYDYWVRVFGSDPGVVGSTVELTGSQLTETTRIVGVLEPGAHYTGTRKPDFYANYSTNDHYQGAAMQDSRTHRMTDIFVRLRPGVSIESARSEVDALSDRLHTEFPEAYPAELGMEVTLTPWQEELTRSARPTFLILMGTVLVVLVLACANVANLTLTRLIRKEHEFATRSAMGASRRDLRRTVLVEHLVLALAGAGLGLVLAVAGMDLLVAYASRFTVRSAEVGIDWLTFGLTLVVAGGVAVFLAWAPGMPIGPAGDSRFASGSHTRVSSSRARRQVQRGLVVVQLGLSFALLVGAGLLMRTLLNLYAVDPGVDTENVIAMDAFGGFRNDPTANRQLFEGVMEEVRHFPGVRSVATASWPPLRSNNPIAWSFRVEGGDETGARSPQALFNSVSPSYFETVGLPLIRGRLLTRMDDADADPVALINQSMARTYFGGEDPLVRRIAWSFSGVNWSNWARIVGVVGDTRDAGLDAEGVHVVYRPAAQANFGPTIIVKSTGDPRPLARTVTEAVHARDETRPVDRVQTLAELRDEDVAPERLNATLFGAFAALALSIAAVGVLGVLAFNVSQRTHEFGIRMAVGAEQRQVLGLVLREGILLAGVALALGALGGAAIGRILSGFLFGIESLDVATFVGSGVLLGLVALGASLLPARRATKVDPIQALRSE